MTRPLVKRLTIRQAIRMLGPEQVCAAADGDRLVAVVKSKSGQLYIAEDSCPHDGGLLSNGFVTGETLVCARHQWEFALATGRCPHGRDRQIVVDAVDSSGAAIVTPLFGCSGATNDGRE